MSPQGLGYPGTPGIHSAEQVAGWTLVTDAVHRAGGRIFLQLWHVGRISHPSLQPGGALPVAPSAIAPAGQAWTLDGMKPYVTPHALETGGDCRHRRGFPARRAPCAAGGFRRRRTARRQRLSDRSVFARRRQPAHRRLRRQRAKPRALPRRSDRGDRRRMGRRARRRAAVADQSVQRHDRQQPRRDICRPRSARSSGSALPICISSSRRRAIPSPQAKCRT